MSVKDYETIKKEIVGFFRKLNKEVIVSFEGNDVRLSLEGGIYDSQIKELESKYNLKLVWIGSYCLKDWLSITFKKKGGKGK